jgi:hypothetical protein
MRRASVDQSDGSLTRSVHSVAEPGYKHNPGDSPTYDYDTSWLFHGKQSMNKDDFE